MVSRAAKLLILGGAVLLLLGMTYGLWYAVFAEHQRLDAVGGALASAFTSAAAGNQQAARDSLAQYGRVRAQYIREVDAHSHWTGLALLLVLLGAAFGRLGFSQRTRFLLALILLVSAAGFPASVLAENMNHGMVPQFFAAFFPALLVLGIALAAVGLLRGNPQPR